MGWVRRSRVRSSCVGRMVGGPRLPQPLPALHASTSSALRHTLLVRTPPLGAQALRTAATLAGSGREPLVGHSGFDTAVLSTLLPPLHAAWQGCRSSAYAVQAGGCWLGAGLNRDVSDEAYVKQEGLWIKDTGTMQMWKWSVLPARL